MRDQLNTHVDRRVVCVCAGGRGQYFRATFQREEEVKEIHFFQYNISSDYFAFFVSPPPYTYNPILYRCGRIFIHYARMVIIVVQTLLLHVFLFAFMYLRAPLAFYPPATETARPTRSCYWARKSSGNPKTTCRRKTIYEENIARTFK